MSLERCEKLAEVCGDDPAIIKTLAGYQEPPPEDDLVNAIARHANSLRPHLQRTLLNLAAWLLSRQSQARHQLMEDQLYLERPDGDGYTIDVNGDPMALSEHELRLAVKTAVNIALSRD